MSRDVGRTGSRRFRSPLRSLRSRSGFAGALSVCGSAAHEPHGFRAVGWTDDAGGVWAGVRRSGGAVPGQEILHVAS